MKNIFALKFCLRKNNENKKEINEPECNRYKEKHVAKYQNEYRSGNFDSAFIYRFKLSTK